MEVLESLPQDFQMTFGTEHGTRTLAWLAHYCHVRRTTVGASEGIEVLEGRRQVYLEIQRLLLSPKVDERKHQAQLERKEP